MKLKVLLTVVVIALLVIPSYLGASTVVDTTEFIFGPVGGENFPFIATEEPLTYKAVLTDFEFPAPFISLRLAITKGGEKIASISGPGTLIFDVVKGAAYFANVIGVPDQIPDTDQRAGLFNLQIMPVPIPTTLMLFGSGLLGLIAIRRRGR